MKRIAVWNTAFLGDTVLMLPLLANLRRHFPDAHITVYIRNGLEAIFQDNPLVNRVVPCAKQGGLKGWLRMGSLLRSVARQRYDLWISAHTSPRSAILARCSGAATRIGYKSPYGAVCYTHQVDRCFTKFAEIERLSLLLQPLGIIPEIVWPEIVLPQEDREAATAFFMSLDGPVLGLHPGSTWGTKQWPAAYFVDIGARALDLGAHVLLFAGPGEESVAATVYSGLQERAGAERCKTQLHNFANALPLSRFAAYLGKLSCYVTNDSGPMHLAWAQRTPVTAIFGPTVRELGFFPRGEGARVFEVELSCRPCGLHGPQVCPLKHHNCMRKVLPAHVWCDVEKKLRCKRISL